MTMDMHELTRELKQSSHSKIVLLVADGLGGLPMEPGGLTELETARTPHLDWLAECGVSGLSIPVKPGITPGSGPGHLGLFGYDPLVYRIGRGALEATGIGFELGPRDVAARGNFCTLDGTGKITDRRAGRIGSDESRALVVRLREARVPGVELFVEPVKEHRFVVVFRGDGLQGDVHDTDPQETGVPRRDPVAFEPQVGGQSPFAPKTAQKGTVPSGSQRTADVARQFIAAADKLLAGEKKANGLTLRGFSARPALPGFAEVYGLRAAAIAVYPMYKGLARLAGMEIVGQAQTLAEQVAVLGQRWADFDFFFLHFKYTDSTGEDGDFAGKVRRIEELDAAMPGITALKPTVLIVTGDHSTPSYLKSHSWHPVPTLLVSDCCRADGCRKFSEGEALRGGLGQFEAKYLMLLALANAGRLGKYGA